MKSVEVHVVGRQHSIDEAKKPSRFIYIQIYRFTHQQESPFLHFVPLDMSVTNPRGKRRLFFPFISSSSSLRGYFIK